jgi:hypothetical protein
MKSYKHTQSKKCKQSTTKKLCKSKCNKNKVQQKSFAKANAIKTKCKRSKDATY